MVSAADKARRKAEARRLRILARSAERLDVVNGLVPSSATTLDGTTVASGVVVDVAPAVDDAAAAATVETTESTATPVATDQVGTAAPVAETAAASSSGSRRMAAMRRRRYVSKSKPKEKPKEEETKIETVASGEVRKDEDAVAEATVVETIEEKEDVKEEKKVEIKNKVEESGTEPALVVEAKLASSPTDQKTEEKPTPSATSTPGSNEKDGKENEPPAVVPTSNPTPDVEEKKEGKSKPKKYMGVARMRRKILKEKKAQRIKDIADAEVMQSGNTSPVMERELAAEMATMDVTASMVRQGGAVVDDSKSSLNGIMSVKKSLKKRWLAALIPPMKLVPRLVTLFLLFFAGLDLGTQPHRSGGQGEAASLASSMGARDLSVVGGLIGHVEPSLTKPWEYGMGGKVAFMVGMAPSSPPTAMPTSFNNAGMLCAAADGDESMEECLAAKEKDKLKANPKATKSDSMVNIEKKGGKKKNSIKVQFMEDELDSSRTRPRGVSHDDEFADTIPTNGKSNNIDPLFQVDLDALLQNAQLPFPIDFAAKCAIGFHRAWVYYLWTLPTSLMKSMAYAPKNLLSGWVSNPPWILGVVLLIRFVARVLAGNGSLEKEKSIGGSGKDDNSGGAGGQNLDVLGKVVETAKNYASSTFPKTMLVMGTLFQVMRVDMYVLLCGMLIGLVVPGGSRVEGGGGTSRPVLGDGEL
mmetsp:Transcript_23737/g.49675  ORF Transcript_23737/g.49675 Transcript_23737/m.49675 type:complete len:698 (+) Transcript_23737:110-2203(+)